MLSNLFIFSTIASSLLFAFFVWLIAHYTLTRQSNPDRERVSTIIALTLLCWFSAVLLLAKAGIFLANPLFAPGIVFGFLLLFELLRRAFFSQTIRKIASDAPMVFLITVQTYRIVGVGFLALYTQNLLPAAFAIPSGWGDIIIGATAPTVAAIYYLGKPYARRLATIWNYLGIADLIMAIGVGILAFSKPVQLLQTTPSTELLALFPMATVPLFAVPLAFFLHLLCLRILKVEAKFKS
ncbi:MAG: hypothetical protein HYR95_01235 [Candidatus Colwellbacteria bacterium]|nr:hypothetical protein [Candidatus Colwellbacteria bacterium]